MTLNNRLERCEVLLWDYQYITHPKKIISFPKQYGTSESDPVSRQKSVAGFLAWTIEEELGRLVNNVDESHCSAETTLLLVQELVHRFRRLANDPDELLSVQLEILNKRLSVVRHSKDRGKGRPFHQQTLEMERNEVICQMKSSSQSISPEAASTPSSDMSSGSKRRTKPACGLFFSIEIAQLLEDSANSSDASRFISSMSFVKHRGLNGKGVMEFPTLHRAFLFWTEPEARSWLESYDRSFDLVDFFNRNVAHVAAEKGRVHLLNTILPGHRESLDTIDALGRTPLIVAVTYGQLDFRVFAEEACEGRQAGNGKDAGAHAPKRDGNGFAQATHDSHILLAA